MEVCRICLAIDAKFYSTKQYNLEYYYEEITGLVDADERLPSHICWECAHKLDSFYKFKEKAMKCHDLLQALLYKNQDLSLNAVSMVDRTLNGLESGLCISESVVIDNLDTEEMEAILKAKEKRKPKKRELLATKVEVIDDYKEQTFKVEDESYVELDNEEEYVENAEEYYEIPMMQTTAQEQPVKVEDAAEIGDQQIYYFDVLDNNTNENNEEDQVYLQESMEEGVVAEETEAYMDDSSYYVTDGNETMTDDATTLTHMVNEIEESSENDEEESANENDMSTEIVRERGGKKNTPTVINEQMFHVKTLTVEEQIQEIEKRKDQMLDRKYICQFCYKGYLDVNAYDNHMRRHTEEAGTYMCGICKVRFPTRDKLRRHVASAHTYKFSCKQCAFVTTRRHDAKHHEEFHNGTLYQCPHCNEKLTKYSSYMAHIRQRHPSEFVCVLCGHSFVSSKGLAQHLAHKHRFEEHTVPPTGPRCDDCDVRFISDSALQRHLKVADRHRLGIRREGAIFLKRNKTKSFPQPIPCEQCDEMLRDSRTYFLHFRKEHPDCNRTRFDAAALAGREMCMCDVCGKMYQNQAHLRDHMFTHTGERTFKCPHCDRTYNRRYAMLVHIRQHDEQRRQYVCKLCGKNFANPSNLNRHKSVHTGLRPHKCEHCGKAFKQALEMRSHINYVHLKKPWPKRIRPKVRIRVRQTKMEDDEDEQ